MTRRKFVQKVIKAGSAVVLGVWWLAKKTAPRRFVWAVKTKQYPGRLRPLRNITKESKWSG
jgi:hypothetical protein